MAENPEEFYIPNESPVFQGRDVDKILLHTTAFNASDVTIQTNCEIIAEIYGRLRKITRHKLTYGEVVDMLVYITKSDGAFTQIASSKAHDIAHEVKPDRNTKFRYRVNATGIQTEGQLGVQITLRTIPSLPPKLADMKLPQEVLDSRAPKQGLVLVTGATGSGKSTLLASIIRDLLEDPDSHRKILTYEQPIEFVYDEIEMSAASIAQTQIPDMLPNFEEALRNALRRKPAVILVGEMRDRETISEGITASMTGHLVYSTVHTNGVADTVRRMINSFSKEEQHSRGVDIVSALRMIISQMLLPSTDGKRIAIREYLVMNEKIANEMMDEIDNLAVCTRRLLKKHGRTFLQDATEKYKAGLLDAKQYGYIQALSDGHDIDLMN
jgi:defect-in-organelle-trafficking protein DotB